MRCCHAAAPLPVRCVALPASAECPRPRPRGPFPRSIKLGIPKCGCLFCLRGCPVRSPTRGSEPRFCSGHSSAQLASRCALAPSSALTSCPGLRRAAACWGQKKQAKDNTNLASTRACLLKTCLQEAPPSVEVQLVPESHVWSAAVPSVVLQVPPPDLVLGERAAALEVLGVQFAPLFR